jgi:uncharacterized membrane protein YcgQ (UPF0703/DUF1980 family)
MKTILKPILVIGLLFVILISLKTDNPERVEVKDLVEHIEKHIGKTVEVEGKVVHVCSLYKNKLRVSAENAVSTIQIIPKNPNTTYDDALFQKTIRIVGVVQESRVPKQQIDDMEQNLIIPCSIDGTACGDTVWIENKRRNGTIAYTSKHRIKALRKTMEKTNKDYLSTVTIVAERVELH